MKKRIQIDNVKGFEIGDVLYFKTAPFARGIVRDSAGFVSRVYFYDTYGDFLPQTLTVSNFDLFAKVSHIERAH